MDTPKFLSTVLFLFLYSCNPAKHAANTSSTNQKHSAIEVIPYHPLMNEHDLDVLIKEIGNAKIVLLGEASHGTSEYYTWRAAISKRLIQEKGFNFIAVEGDWTDSYKVNRFIKGDKKDSAAAVTVLKEYNRWPTWLWANYETASLITWLNNYNQNIPVQQKVGFYGLDVFNIAEAAADIKPYLQPSDTNAINAVNKFRECFKPFADDEQKYVKSVTAMSGNCSVQSNTLLQAIKRSASSKDLDPEDAFVMLQNAQVVYDGELYLRTSKNNYVNGWNLRDNHMVETIARLLNLYGTHAKAIIWAHNNHVGNARYATMHWTGKTNTGQLLKNKYGDEKVFSVGFGTYTGSVIAAEKWGTPYKKMQLASADDSSWEQKMHQLNSDNKIILSKDIRNYPNMLRWISQIAVGVIYHPLQKAGTYSLSVVPNRYDAYIFIDHTNALHPIETVVKGTTAPVSE
jgi:Erythromycin esterase homolog